MKFDIQRHARDWQDTYFRGRRRLAGNAGKLFIGGVLIFELSSFEAKVTAERDEVIIGQDADSKITKLTGEGSFVIKQVFSRGFNKLLENWQQGYDERFILVGVIRDPDAVGHQEERVRFENVAINSLEIMKFEKGSVIEKTIDFQFTPSDVVYEQFIDLPNESVVHERNGSFYG